MPKALFAATLLLAVGCQVPAPAPAGRAVVGQEELPKKVVGWRLVERSYAEADADRGVALDGEIPGRSPLLVYEPVFEESRTHECGGGTFKVRTVCDHEIRLRIQGSLSRTVGERVTATCRIDAPDALYHEVAVDPSAGGIEILAVAGAARPTQTKGRYLVRGDRDFDVVFTSCVAGRGTVTLSVMSEVGQEPARRR